MNKENPAEEIPSALALVIFRRMIEKYEIRKIEPKQKKSRTFDEAV